RMKTQPPLVRPQGIAVLNPKTPVYVCAAGIVYPANPKLNDAVGFEQALQQGIVGITGVGKYEIAEPTQDFFGSVKEFGLMGVATAHAFAEVRRRLWGQRFAPGCVCPLHAGT